MRVFEGIATSGKSTVIAALKERLGKKAIVYGESVTHIPIKDRREELHIQFFFALVDRAAASGHEVVLFDRLYMTQAFRAGVSAEAYRELERRLLRYDTQTVLLEVDDAAIASRLTRAFTHRDAGWKAYVEGKAGSLQAVADMYAAQQHAVHQLAQTSLVPCSTFDTTNHNYGLVAKTISANIPLFEDDVRNTTV